MPDEAERFRDVLAVDPTRPIEQLCAVLFAIQPSSLGREAMRHFVQAIRGGQATLILEDPAPQLARGLTPTDEPRRSANPMLSMMAKPVQDSKGELESLWSLLGVVFVPDAVVWHNDNPYGLFPCPRRSFSSTGSREPPSHSNDSNP